MKTIRLYLCILLLPFLASCSDDETNGKEIIPIELSKRIARVDHVETTDQIDILKGNGDYKITLRDMFVGDEEFKNIPYEGHVRVYIEDNRIMVERILLEDYYMCIRCYLSDGEGVKKTFVIENPNMLGLHDFDD